MNAAVLLAPLLLLVMPLVMARVESRLGNERAVPEARSNRRETR